MSKNMQPIARRCKQLNLSPATMGYKKKTTNRNPHGQMRRKQTEYGKQVTEKQKVKFIYGIEEKQFRTYYEKASQVKVITNGDEVIGKTGDEILISCERRLDNVVYRLGFANTRRQARELVSHAHFTVNGKKVNIPSYQVKAGQEIAVCDGSRSKKFFKSLVGEDAPVVSTPKWLERDRNELKGKVLQLPTRADIDFPVEEHLIVELYSK